MISHSPEKFQDVFQAANECFQKSPDWVTFFREVLGIDGVIRHAFPDADALLAFEKSSEYAEIQQMLVRLRGKNAPTADDGKEPTRVITVRLPKSLHESLRIEAHEHRTSMNKLCISKLLQLIDEAMIPNGSPETAQSEMARPEMSGM